jgi:uncharacterized repeat protein (TIGR02543 family)
MAWGTTHAAASVKSTSGSAYFDDHYEFAGWYLDQSCTHAYTGTEKIISDLTLYGKWERYLLVEYYWNYWETGYTTPDDDDRVVYGSTPTSFTPEMTGYTFGGWYQTYSGGTFSDPYTASPMTADLNLYAKWIPRTGTAYTVRYYQQDPEGDGYTEITADAQTLTGTTDQEISEITRTYDGFTLDHITYESSNTAAQSTPLPIQRDGSLVVRVYYDRNTYQVTYDGNGSNGGVLPTDDTQYRSGASVTVAQDTMIRSQYRFTGWNTSQDGTGTSYAPGDTFSITQNTTLYAQWTNWSIRVILTDDTSAQTPLSGGQFALYSPEPPDASTSALASSTLTVGDTTWYLVGVLTTDQNGTAIWNGLTQDSYYVTELSAPDGYDLPNETGRTVTAVLGETVDVPFVNAHTTIVPTGVSVPATALPVGIALVSCAGLVLLVVSRRKSHRR